MRGGEDQVSKEVTEMDMLGEIHTDREIQGVALGVSGVSEEAEMRRGLRVCQRGLGKEKGAEVGLGGGRGTR